MANGSVSRNRASLLHHVGVPTPERWARRWSRATPEMGSCHTVVADGVFWGFVAEGCFSPLELSTGAPLWRAALPDPKQLPTGVAVDSTTVVVALERLLVSFRRADGELLWSRETATAAEYGAPVIDGARIFSAHVDRIVASSLDDGRPLWTVAAQRPSPFVLLEDRLIVPAEDGLLVLELRTGVVLGRAPGRSEFALAYDADGPALLVGRGWSLDIATVDGQVRERVSLHSFLTDEQLTGTGRRSILSLRRGATISGNRLFGGCADLGSWFCVELGRAQAPALIREGRFRQYAKFASSSTHVFASTWAVNEVDVFDHSLRWLGALPTGENASNFVMPDLVPTEGALVVLSGTRVTCFAAASDELTENALQTRRKSEPLSAAVLAEVQRLGGRVGNASAKVPLPLSAALTTFLSIEWPEGARYRAGSPRTAVAWEPGTVLEEGMASDFKGPLVGIMTSERLGTWHAVAAEDLTADPLVFEISHEGGQPLPLGTPLSKLLGGVLRWS